jgi:hypothetical protein
MNRRTILSILILAGALVASAAAPAAEKKKTGTTAANIVGSAVTRNLDGSYDIRVTVRSADKGPEYYCDRIEFVDAEGKVLHTHRIAKPHVNEQPFSETLRNLRFPEGLEQVTVRARMRPDHATGKERVLKLPKKK